jgi:hypothetical protein
VREVREMPQPLQPSPSTSPLRERGDVDGEGCNGEGLEGGVRGLVVRISVCQQSDGNNQVSKI